MAKKRASKKQAPRRAAESASKPTPIFLSREADTVTREGLPELTPGVMPSSVVHTPRPQVSKPPVAAPEATGDKPVQGKAAQAVPRATGQASTVPDVLPGSMRSTMEAVTWPAVPDSGYLRQLAIQFQLEQSQWWSLEKIREHQFAQLAYLLRHADAHVPFYRALFKRIGFDPRAPLRAEDWERLPTLERRDLQESFDALRSTSIPRSHGNTFMCSTSGSTGTPARVIKTDFQQLIFQANTLRDHLWHKRDLSLRYANIRGWENFDDYPYPNGGIGERWGNASAMFAGGPAFMLGLTAKVHEQAEWLQRVKPNYLMSYPSNFEALAHYCIDNGIEFPSLVHLRTMSEALRPEVRDICRKAWNVEIKDSYSTEEIGVIAQQSPVCEELLVAAETNLIEVLDDEDRPCAPGEVGRIVVTPLHAFAMPLIRLSLGDLAEVGGPAACGRGLPVLKQVLGRQRNMVRLPNGQVHYPLYHYLMDGFDKVIQFQIVRKTIDLLEVRLVARAKLDAGEEGTLAERVQGRFQYPFQVRFVYVDEIQRTPRGKYIDFISEVD